MGTFLATPTVLQRNFLYEVSFPVASSGLSLLLTRHFAVNVTPYDTNYAQTTNSGGVFLSRTNLVRLLFDVTPGFYCQHFFRNVTTTPPWRLYERLAMCY